jgi:hypothetical protein
MKRKEYIIEKKRFYIILLIGIMFFQLVISVISYYKAEEILFGITELRNIHTDIK